MFIGRRQEVSLIQSYLADRSKVQLIVIYGRRRVGKSTLIKESVKKENHVLFFEGIEGETTKVQIDQFLTDLSRQTGKVKLAAKNWREVFQGLSELIEKGRWVLVFDEFPWMAAGRSSLVSDLKLYWDRWSHNKQLVLFLCGSVASFMTQHIVHSKALHNRKTLELCLHPLSPKESGKFIPQRSFHEKAALFMLLGGIPKYLEQINPRISVEKNINRLCFTAGGFFVNEYETLFKEQFRSIKTYQKIVEELAQTPLNLSDLSRKTKLPKGGGLQSHLENLIRAQFVRGYSPYTAKSRMRTRTKVYKLVDPFLIFYFRYIHHHRSLIEKNKEEDLFRSLVGPSLRQYFGFAFERLCEEAFDDIRKKLGLALADILNMGPYFQHRTTVQEGLQIDNLIRRRDGVWTMMEYKYSEKPIGLEVVHEVEQKIKRLHIPPSISVEKVCIASHGVTKPTQATGYFDAILTLKDLFES